MMYKACIFDMDGTIINTLDSLAYFGNQALAVMNLPPVETELYKKMVGNGVDKLIERILIHSGAENTPENHKTLLKEYSKLYESDPFHLVTAYDGMNELLHALKEEGFLLAVLSNKPHDMAVFIAEKYFPNLFDIVEGQKESVPAKPDPTALSSIIERLAIAKENVLYCGDSDVDMQTARNTGVDGAGVLWGFRDQNELVSNGATFLAHKPNDLYSILRKEKESFSMRVL
ncbi:HAD family hydrolase [Scatolibacter rhodanostii]|uniref:HAD family hydrolase n=1 Tax=Scatolibacter rhodanostii TaxID=2014781 RepID=UPI000C0820FD|nr:HAD family hydrolase [Scatolibacter rhodanostii]